MKNNKTLNTLLFFGAGLAVGYLLYAPATASASNGTPELPTTGTLPTGQRLVKIGAKPGNCNCANGTVCTGLSDCRCCDKRGGAIVYAGQTMKLG